jgi:hypothetical protein
MDVTGNQPYGTPTWIDLGVPDLERATGFYGSLFGWEFEVGPEEAMRYTTCRLRGRRVAGIAPNPTPAPPAPGGPCTWPPTTATAPPGASPRRAGRWSCGRWTSWTSAAWPSPGIPSARSVDLGQLWSDLRRWHMAA